MKSLKMRWWRVKMRMSWRMNKIRIIKKLFVSLTLLVFCELILLQWIRGSNSRFDSRLYIDRSASLSIDPIHVSIYQSDPRLYLSIGSPRNVPRIRSVRGISFTTLNWSASMGSIVCWFNWSCGWEWFGNSKYRSIGTKYPCILLVKLFWLQFSFDQRKKITYQKI